MNFYISRSDYRATYVEASNHHWDHVQEKEPLSSDPKLALSG